MGILYQIWGTDKLNYKEERIWNDQYLLCNNGNKNDINGLFLWITKSFNKEVLKLLTLGRAANPTGDVTLVPEYYVEVAVK